MADITDLAGLKTWASTDSANSTIAPGTYTLDADLIKANNGTLTIDGTGDVVIDGDSLYNVQVQATGNTVNFVGSASGDFQFTNADADGFLVTYSSGALSLNCDYCIFDSAADSGFKVNSAFSDAATIVLNHVQATNNGHDGFSLDGGATGSDIYLFISNFISSGNTNTTDDGDGVTAHNPNHYVFLQSGSCYGNFKSGVALIGGAKVWGDDLLLYGNGGAAANAAQVWLSASDANAGSPTYGHFRNCRLYPDSRTGNYLVRLTAATLTSTTEWVEAIFDECEFDGQDALTVSTVVARNASTARYRVAFNQSRFSGMSASKPYLDFEGCTIIDGLIGHCTFQDGYRHLDYNVPALVIFKNIFNGASNNAVVCRVSDSYYFNRLNNSNCFYDNASDFFANPSGMHSDDVTTDPKLDSDGVPTHMAIIQAGIGYLPAGTGTRRAVAVPALVGSPITGAF